MVALTCPKCESPMRSYERNGITIDQCTACRGVFLDRGELERLIDAEGAYYGEGRGRRDERDERDERHREHERDRHESDERSPFGALGGLGGFGGGRGHGGGHGHGRKRKREGFLGDLFD
ncbi:MAG: zf-TFIIB domain-containing protein [Actinomycetota bacterium]|nr:zf-TFIIB domain-containing protein [Actinomycetota bacterium]